MCSFVLRDEETETSAKSVRRGGIGYLLARGS
jgi:hypothetical protein